ncbi:myricetin 3-O-rhamnoside 1,2-glucosyltransferase UGT709G2-like [Cornus florida]|uniref:myricetin 3-O-rhamnoside 1,2-glucosyltransferase UGT709G2-like n=1 Tax=Cornus florida TaxID=4283 RepID=UPI00289E80F4|nr:myricetin 3-O-rhamnoside 1,2-glucosyltransferase UGT709G2-like [Cornus florida]
MDVTHPQPHVVILPFASQGHIKPMLMLAQLLSNANFYVTFVNTHHNHNLILKMIINNTSFRSRFPRLRFEVIPDGLSPEHPRSGPQRVDLYFSIGLASKAKLKDILMGVSLTQEWSPPKCLIADGIMSFAIDVAEELHIPVITFRSYNASCTWINFHIENLIQQGEIPFHGAPKIFLTLKFFLKWF